MIKILLVLPLLVTVVVLQGCGQKELANEQAGSFAAAALSHSPLAETPISTEFSSESDDGAATTAEDPPAAPTQKRDDGKLGQPIHEDERAKEGPLVQELTVQKLPDPEAKAADKAGEASKADGSNAAPLESKMPGSQAEPSEEKVVKQDDKQTAVNAAPKTGPVNIGWSEFFDGEDQTTPSDRFWDLSGSTVTIKGFMGEVLSFEKNWFLLIPEPGAECPFDNGDETYWNKIMIVFVPDDVKLRYKPEPLEITGRLDVGIKIDESGYKTMFRLYDASFKEIKS